MIILLRKRNVLLFALVFVLLLAFYGLNISEYEPASAIAEGETDSEVTSTKRAILIDAGHGGEDPGAVSSYSGTKEKDINLKIAFFLKECLEDQGYSIMMTREEDVLEYSPETTNIVQKRRQDLLRRKKMMDEAGADIVVSIHLNKFPETQYFGAQTFYPHNSPESQKLAVAIQNELREKVDPNNKRVAMVRGKPNETPIIILQDLKTPTVIVECGFLSNPNDDKKLGTEEYQKKVASAIADGIKAYFKDK
jgi:N-acetylmuramoyl-L-alanine amidase